MGHFLQMNTFRTGQAEMGEAINQVNQAAVVKAVREKKLVMSTRVMALTLKMTEMMSFLLLSPHQTRNMQTTGKL